MTATTKHFRALLVAAGFFGLTGVALGAMGAHALAGRLAERGMTHAWETAADYHLFHAAALLGVAACVRALVGSGSQDAASLVWAGRCWAAGILLFSGSLYLLALGGPRWLGPVTPLGGVAFMAGWVCAIVAAYGKEDGKA
jgi:uncharacterized membrane protein YgdD (TMEM256/DUF423 family)